MKYQWDESKRNSNIAKHGVDFVDAAAVFSDDERIETVDTRQDYGEQRLQTIGMVEPNILFVVFTMRDKGETRRIISARMANSNERKLYYSMLAGN